MSVLGNYDYECPHCHSKLSEKEVVTFRFSASSSRKGVISLSSKPGIYETRIDPPHSFEKGEEVDFHCPSCETNLQSDRYKNYVSIEMVVNDLIRFEVLFSRLAGIKSTYILTEDIVERYGHDIPDMDELL